MTNRSFLPILRVSGTNYEIGFEIGRKFKERIGKSSQRIELLREVDGMNPRWFDGLHEAAKKFLPRYMDEILGIAEGCDMD